MNITNVEVVLVDNPGFPPAFIWRQGLPGSDGPSIGGWLVIQTDAGITGFAHMSAAQALPVIPHAGGLQAHALHLLFAEVGIPYSEYFIFGAANAANPDPIFTGVQTPTNGWFSPPPGVGAGIDFTESAHEFLYEITGALPEDQ